MNEQVLLGIAIGAGVLEWVIVLFVMRPRSRWILRGYDRKHGPPPSEKRPFSEIQTLEDMATRQAAHDAAVFEQAYQAATKQLRRKG